ncbi:MAG: class I SAM-dependent methyltransferase [Acidobacteriota bacterium]
MIDKDKVKAFWDARAASYGELDFNSIANLEQDPSNLALKVCLENEKVFEYMGPDLTGRHVVDLGAGVGQWAFRFIERGAASVTAVEYSASLARVGRLEAERRGTENLEFVVSPAEEFRAEKTFDVVYISGLFVYMNDDQAELFTSGLPSLCRPKTLVLLRDGTGIAGRHEINDRHSEHLNTQYSATYRTAEQYEALFAEHGFSLERHENMFAEGSPLNKYPETRLRIYRFKAPGSAEGA